MRLVEGIQVLKDATITASARVTRLLIILRDRLGGQGVVPFLVLVDIHPTWQAAIGTNAPFVSFVSAKCHWMNSLVTQGLGQGAHDAKFYPLPCSNTQRQQAAACLCREHEAEGEWQSREWSMPRNTKICCSHPLCLR